MKQQTMLTDIFIKSEAGFDLGNLQRAEQNIVFKNYYYIICSAILKLHYLKPTPSQIEAVIKDGYININGYQILSKLDNFEDRNYWFLKAQSNQLMFDMMDGRTAMISDKVGKKICDDSKTALDMLGFVDNGTLFC